MTYKICVFAGTTEGRELLEFLTTQPVEVSACVATEYGEALLPAADNLSVCAKRLPQDAITEMLSTTAFDMVIDATHPYATSVTESISTACEKTETYYVRLLRKPSDLSSDVVYVPTTEAAVEFLSATKGSILLTTGSKELAKYSALPNFDQRVYARVLPMEASLEVCRNAGLTPSHIIAMQGPFSEEINLALLHNISAAWFVTKDGGELGGFDAKLSAARKAHTKLVVIGRPAQKNGMSYSQVVNLLCKRFGLTYTPRVHVLGIGLGNHKTMTQEVRQAIEEADCLIGAKRMLKAVALPTQHIYSAITPTDIANFILTHHQYQRFAVVMSGDVGFFSGAKKLLPLLESCNVDVLPGLSSLVYLCARLKISYEDIFVTSVHGRQHNIVGDIRSHTRVFVLLGGDNGVCSLCRLLSDAGLGHLRMSIGERLSYPDEKITQGTVEDLLDGNYQALSVALIENDHPDAIVTHGLSDDMFVRGAKAGAVVPMTKSEVRSVCLSKLQLTEDAICWDIGAGTGSVAIEMALQAQKGKVYAVEYKSAAIELLHLNKEKFSRENLFVISGRAPVACYDLPAPTHVFIGGSSGNLRSILALVRKKNPSARIVASALSLESISELSDYIKEFSWKHVEVISLQIARDQKLGSYHLMKGQNPIYIFTLQDGENS